MGSVFVRNISNVLTAFVGRVLGFENGTFTLSTGNHRIEVATTMGTASSVWIKFDNVGFDGCGQATVNKIGYVITNNAILFDAEVKSQTCEINWFAVN